MTLRPDARLLLLLAALVVFAGTVVYETRVLAGRRQELTGHRNTLGQSIAHAADYNAARAGGEQPLFVPGERNVSLTDVPSRTAALSLGGLRGFLAIYLWVDAESAKNRRVHDDLLDRYHRIAELQSDYPEVWEFNAWNMAWNVSVQWASAERRYEWIRHGIDFLAEGIRRNPRSVTLLEAMGRIYYQRIAHNVRQEDREYFIRRTIEEDGQHPLRIAHKWYVLARRIQDETGEKHFTYSYKVLHQQSAFAAHEYAKLLTQQALEPLARAAEAQRQGQTAEAQRLLAEGRAQLLVAGRWWTRAVEEWGRQRAQYPDDFNARLFGDGALTARGIVAEELLGRLTPQLLRDQPHDFRVIVDSALGLPLLTEDYIYESQGPAWFHVPYAGQ